MRRCQNRQRWTCTAKTGSGQEVLGGRGGGDNAAGMPRFGDLLLARLAARGRSIRAYAVAVGRDDGFMSRVLHGKRRPPLRELARWYDVLSIPAAERPAFDEAAQLCHAPPAIAALVECLRQDLAACQASASGARLRKPRRRGTP